jgi:hypothetical protein
MEKKNSATLNHRLEIVVEDKHHKLGRFDWAWENESPRVNLTADVKWLCFLQQWRLCKILFHSILNGLQTQRDNHICLQNWGETNECEFSGQFATVRAVFAIQFRLTVKNLGFTPSLQIHPFPCTTSSLPSGHSGAHPYFRCENCSFVLFPPQLSVFSMFYWDITSPVPDRLADRPIRFHFSLICNASQFAIE